MLSNSAPSPQNFGSSARYHGIQSFSQPLQPCLGRKGLGALLSRRRAIPAPKASQFSGERLAALGALSSRFNADSQLERPMPSDACGRSLASATPRPSPQPQPQPLLARLWMSLCSAAGLALRVIFAAIAIWLASLAPRPSLAAASAAVSAPAGEARVAPSSSNASSASCSGSAAGHAAAAPAGGGFGAHYEAAYEAGAESLAARCVSGQGAGPSGAPAPIAARDARRAAPNSSSSSSGSSSGNGSGSSSGGGAACYSPVLGELALTYEPAASGAAVFRSTAALGSGGGHSSHSSSSARGASHYGQGYGHGSNGSSSSSSSSSSSTYVYGSTTGYGSQQGLQPSAVVPSGIGSSSGLGGSGRTASADGGAAAPTAAGAGGASASAADSTGGGAAAAGGSSSPPSSSPSSQPSAAAAAAALPPGVTAEDVALASALGLGVGEAAVVRLFERCRPSVVNISGMRAMQTFTTLDLTKVPTGQGSGFIWGDKGCVVTAYHLVKGAAEVKVTLYDNSSYTAKVLGYDAAKDIAVLKLSVPKSKLRELQPVTPGPAAGLRVGQCVYGVANPWGLGHTLSQGLVSGLGCELSGCGLLPLKGVIAANTGLGPGTDPGSSGGVLLDSKGTVVGMLVSPPASGGGGGGGGGRSYAVPLDAVRGLVGQILSYGRTVRPALGITMAPPQVLERVGVEGVLVLEVPPGSPAHAAGLRPTHRDIFGDLVLGDVVVGLDGKPVRTASDLYDILDEHRVGDRIKLDVLRDGKATGLTVTLGERVLGGSEE